MKVVIFAGGLGTRISEESYLKPKPMIEIGEKPILWHLMKIFEKQGLTDFIICLGYKGHIIKEYFTKAEIIEPIDLQTQVSLGVALNSAFINGLGVNIIDPVVSETISFRTADGTFHPLIKAGTKVPSDNFILKNFFVQKDNQKNIEIPIFASGNSKMIKNFKIEGNFNKIDKIDIKVNVNENKIVKMRVLVNEIERSVFELSPFSEVLLTNFHRKEKELRREIYNLQVQGFDKDNTQIIKLAKELINHQKKHYDYESALNTLFQFFPNEYTDICYCASNCNKKELSSQYAKIAYEKEKNGTTAHNYALEFQENSPEYLRLMKESVDFGDYSAMFCYGKYLINNGDKSNGEKLIIKSYDYYLNCLRNKEDGEWKFHKLKAIAQYFNKSEIVNEVDDYLINQKNKMINQKHDYIPEYLLEKK